VKLDAGAFPYTLTVGPDNSLWFTEVFASKIGRLDQQLRLHEYFLPVAGTPAQIAFANNTLGYYVDTGNIGLVKPGIFSFDPNNFSPVKVGYEATLRAPTSLALVQGGVFLAQHGASNLAYYNLNSHQWVFFPTSPVAFQNTTLPYFVAANGSMVWFNEHYGNRMARLDAEHGLLTEYSLSDPPASKIRGIDNALTFALGNGKVWFTELTANYVGYVDASYQSTFKVSPASNPNIKLKPGGNVNVTFTVSGQSLKPLTVQFADTENVTGRPRRIMMNANATEIESLSGQKEIVVDVKASETIPAGNYTLLVTVTDGLVNQGAYVKLQIT
jgi:streptogramin lyase